MREHALKHPEEGYDTEALREKAVAAKDAVTDLAGEVKNYAVDRIGKLRTSAGDGIKGVNDTIVEYIQENPYKSIAIAAGAGLFIGLLFKRR